MEPSPVNTPAATTPAATPATALHGFVTDLIGRYRRVAEHADAACVDAATVQQRLGELTLAEAALRLLPGGDTPRSRQIAVIGPTQTGKSTVVNLLLGQPAAEVSPLAGFTIHPQVFCVPGVPQPAPSPPPPAEALPAVPQTLFELAETPPAPGPTNAPADAPPDEAACDAGWIATAFPDWSCIAPHELSRDALQAIGVATLEHGAPGLPACAIWDTPDFDSLAARTYRTGLLTVAALADAYVLVVSKEKYSDLSVWSLLGLLAPLGRPLVICANKLTPDAIAPITGSLQERLDERTPAWRDAPVVPLSYRHPAPPPADEQDAETTALRAAVATAANAFDRGRAPAGVTKLLRRYWSAWTAPVRLEHGAQQSWAELIDTSLQRLLAAYRTEYLEHPQRYDGFRRATAELLHLLELPGVGRTLTRARELITWPARQLLSAGRSLLKPGQTSGGRRLSSEQMFLLGEIDALLTALQREVARRADSAAPEAPVWAALSERLAAELPTLRQAFTDAAERHHTEVQREVHETAGQLHAALQERPTLLNTLRAARVTGEAASIALAVKTGGLHVNDLLFAPAMFGLTSLLTEGALGSLMQRLAAQLKERQYAHARSELIDGIFRAQLARLAERLDDAGLFGLTPDELTAAAAALEKWEQQTRA